MKELKSIIWSFVFYMSLYTLIDCKLDKEIEWIFNISLSLFFSLLVSRLLNYKTKQ
jgi:hypothetical protein